jgi:hypothetical protein
MNHKNNYRFPILLKHRTKPLVCLFQSVYVATVLESGTDEYKIGNNLVYPYLMEEFEEFFGILTISNGSIGMKRNAVG